MPATWYSVFPFTAHSIRYTCPMASFQLRPYREGDEDALNTAFNQAFGTSRSLAEWRWKFQPTHRSDRIIVAVDAEERIVAQYAAVEMRVQHGGQPLILGQPVDVFCLRVPGSARQQVYLNAAWRFFEDYGSPSGFPLLVGFPGPRALRLGQLKLGYVDPVEIPYLTRTLQLRRSWRPPLRVEQEAQGEALDALWTRAAPRYAISTIRDHRWIERRYRSRPNVHYHYAFAWKRGTLHAWGVFRVQGEQVQWVDLLWDGRDPRALVALDRHGVHLARTAGADTLALWLANDPAARIVLQDLGWQPAPPTGLPLLSARPIDPTIDAVDFIHQFYFTMGDADLA